MSEGLRRGDVVRVALDPVRGREQAGHRPALVVAADDYLRAVPGLVVVLPVTTRDRGLPHHVGLIGPELRLAQASYAMTEQPRTIELQRITGRAGQVATPTMAEVDRWLADFLHLRS